MTPSWWTRRVTVHEHQLNRSDHARRSHQPRYSDLARQTSLPCRRPKRWLQINPNSTWNQLAWPSRQNCRVTRGLDWFLYNYLYNKRTTKRTSGIKVARSIAGSTTVSRRSVVVHMDDVTTACLTFLFGLIWVDVWNTINKNGNLNKLVLANSGPVNRTKALRPCCRWWQLSRGLAGYWSAAKTNFCSSLSKIHGGYGVGSV